MKRLIIIKHFALILLLLTLFAGTLFQGQAHPQDNASIDLQYNSWNKIKLQSLIVRTENASWWRESLVDSTLNAINNWNKAIILFSNKYPDFAYLSGLQIEAEVANQKEPGYDIYIVFSEEFKINGQNGLGLSKTSYNRNLIKDCVITLATRMDLVTLTKSDVQNVATHEIGHALGLSHSNSSRDLMYPAYDVFSTENAISTLDLYGVAKFFDWIPASNLKASVVSSNVKSSERVRSAVSLPSDIEFEYTLISNPSPTAITDKIVKVFEIMGHMLLNPIISLMVAVIITLFVAMGLYLRKKNTPSRTKAKDN